MDDTDTAPGLFRLETGAPMERAYPQPPPSIPHRIAGYEIDPNVDKCPSRRDRPNNSREGAPKISEIRCEDREGVALDHVARRRWFCTRCRGPQADAPILAGNSFRNANQLR